MNRGYKKPLGFLLIMVMLCSCAFSAFAMEESKAVAEAFIGTSPTASDAVSDQALDPSPEQKETSITGSITGFHYERVFLGYKPQVIQAGEVAQVLETIESINGVLGCNATLSDGSKVEVACTALWNYDQLPLDTPGNYTLIATLIPPAGFSFGQGVRTSITIRLQVLGEGNMAKIVSWAVPWKEHMIALVAEKGVGGASYFDDLESQERLRCYDENGAQYWAPVVLDTSGVCLEELGVYTVYGKVNPPEGTQFADSLVVPEISFQVSVQEAGKPDLNVFYLWNRDVMFPWIGLPTSPETAVVWMAKGGQPWQSFDPADYSGLQVYGDGLRMRDELFEDGTTYQFQVEYEGGKTGVATFFYDASMAVSYDRGGDRGGDDSVDNDTEPPFTQEPPAPPTPSIPTPNPEPPRVPEGNPDTPEPQDKPSVPREIPPEIPPETPWEIAPPVISQEGAEEKPFAPSPTDGSTSEATKQEAKKPQSPPQEEITKDSRIISGARVAHLLEQYEGAIPFGWDGITLALARDCLTALSLPTEGMLEVKMEKTGADAFDIVLNVDGKPVEHIGESLVQFTIQDGAVPLTLYHEGMALDTVITPSQGFVSFSISHTGSYQLKPKSTTPMVKTVAPTAVSKEAANPLPKPPVVAYLPAFAVVVLLFCGAWLYGRRRHDR